MRNVPNGEKLLRVEHTVLQARDRGMEFVDVADDKLLDLDKSLDELLNESRVQEDPMLWLVVDFDQEKRLLGGCLPLN